MAQVKLEKHQGVDEEGTTTKRYGPEGVHEVLMQTLSKEAFLSLPCTCLQLQKEYDILCLISWKYPSRFYFKFAGKKLARQMYKVLPQKI